MEPYILDTNRKEKFLYTSVVDILKTSFIDDLSWLLVCVTVSLPWKQFINFPPFENAPIGLVSFGTNLSFPGKACIRKPLNLAFSLALTVTEKEINL